MANLNPLELERLKSLLSGKALTMGEKNSTLDMLRSRFPGFFSNLKPGLTEENLKDDNFLIKYLTNPYNRNKIKNALRKELSLSTTQQIELEESLDKPITTEVVGEQPGGQGATAEQAPLPAGTATGTPGGMPGMPSIPSTSSMPRISRNIPRAPEPSKPEIHIANKGGYVTEAGDASKLVRATSSGKIVEAPSKQIFIANKGGVVTGMRNIKSPSWLKTFGSNSQIFAKKNLSRLAGGLGNIFGGVGKGLAGPGLTGGARKLGVSGINFGANLSNQASRLSIASPGKKVFITGILGFMILVFGVAAITPTSTQPGSSQAVNPPYQPSAGSGVFSCPLNSGNITTGSKERGGHCSPGYQTDYPCADPDTTGRATAVDIQSQDKTVYLPKLNNSDVTWTIVKIDTDTNYTASGQTINGGFSVRASAESQGKTYLMRFVHIESTALIQSQTATSGTPVGTYRSQENHVHITMEENGVFRPGDTYFNLCQ